MKNREVSLQEINDLCKWLYKSIADNKIQILIDNDMCQEMCNIFETLKINYIKDKEKIEQLEKENEKLKMQNDILIGKKLYERDKNAKKIKIKLEREEDLKEKINKTIKVLKNNDHEFEGAVHSALNILEGDNKDES